MRTFLIKMNICKPSVNPVLHILGDIFKIVGDVCNNLGEVCKNLIDFIKIGNSTRDTNSPLHFSCNGEFFIMYRRETAVHWEIHSRWTRLLSLSLIGC